MREYLKLTELKHLKGLFYLSKNIRNTEQERIYWTIQQFQSYYENEKIPNLVLETRLSNIAKREK